MTREIKFRAWDPATKMMIWAGGPKPADLKRFFALFTLPPDVLSYPMQYTGLKDKNGTEIYEGDILDSDGELGSVGYHTHAIRFVFKLAHKNEYRRVDGDSYVEVIGNIYENPELLK